MQQQDQQLLSVVSSGEASTVTDVLAKMRSIDGLLAVDDGLKWFNLLYLNVTQRVDGESAASGWRNPAWLLRLDVIFASFYFDAIKSWIQAPGSVARSWKALFELRYATGIDRIQFALAGMNAHINHDLALALLETNQQAGVTPARGGDEYADYEHVNDLLEELMPVELQLLASGILGQLAQDTGKIGHLLAIWNVRAARDLAWDFSGNLRAFDAVAEMAALAVQDQLTGVIGRSLLQVI